MQGVFIRLIVAADPDVFQERLNRFIEGLPEEAILVDIKFSTSSSGNQTTYAALVQYKTVEEWKE
ncbi:hypothetical protein Mlute_02309 [Meiothermus luteus]|jgi:hypothetical protein|uniref:Antibiotic biosynthesis monooxygenase n=1 Tax=Meiothermus luteus TaxID=2026184 RepID=A0A399EHW3_9DEIN|nr:hypothetical protein [Meiothermus luteus]RIH83083.1 hypothetical protein Mlute_02309 [Meiothermus luteus]RMH55645.1 MAG: hypothetical protein D6684_06895 [Deinococcota bacterium]